MGSLITLIIGVVADVAITAITSAIATASSVKTNDRVGDAQVSAARAEEQYIKSMTNSDGMNSGSNSATARAIY